MTTTPQDALPEGEKRSDVAPDAANVTDTLGEATAETAGDVLTLLAIEAIGDDAAKRVTKAAWEFLHAPGDKTVAEMVQHGQAVGGAIGDYMMTGDDAPAVVEEMHKRVERMRYERLIADARTELAQREPDLLRLLALACAADSIFKPEGEEVARLKADITAASLHSEGYDRMCELAGMAAEAVEHLADKGSIQTATTMDACLRRGDPAYIASAKANLVPRLRRDAGKNGDTSKAALNALADRIAELADRMLNPAQ